MPIRSPDEVAVRDGPYEPRSSLHRNFSAIPEDCVGIGERVFAEVGAPKRWLHQLLLP